MVALLVVALGVLGLVLMTLAFLWPGTQQWRADVGPADRFEPGSVRSFFLEDGRVTEVDSDVQWLQLAPRRGGFHLARLEDGEFRAYPWDDGRMLASRIFWSTTYPWPGEPMGHYRDLFSEHHGLFFGRHGAVWNIRGEVVGGPGRPLLVQYPAHVTGAGRVLVDLSQSVERE
jgi:hypothetical protein